MVSIWKISFLKRERELVFRNNILIEIGNRSYPYWTRDNFNTDEKYFRYKNVYISYLKQKLIRDPLHEKHRFPNKLSKNEIYMTKLKYIINF